MATLPDFNMPFEPMTIEHLGLRLYSTLPPVIAEMVSNAFDAESPKVEVVIPTDGITPESEVVVRDYGHGMSPQELQEEYLPIGRNRRGQDSAGVMSKNGRVRVTGRKGLGKLSAFGVADEVEIRSVAHGFAVTLRLNYSAMRIWAVDHPKEPYQPVVVEDRTGQTTDSDGVEITLRKLHRTNRISPDVVRRGLAKRLAMIGPSFEVLVNGEPTKAGDRMQRSQCPEDYSWDIEDIPNGKSLGDGRTLSGWLGFIDASSQANRGIDIFASGKAVELSSYFNLGSTHAQFARAHLIGEIHADFLDAPEDDLVATARNSVVWESAVGQVLQEWGQETLKWAFKTWVELRRKQKAETIIEAAGFDKWLAARNEREQKVARRMVRLLVDDERLDPDSARPLLEIIKSSVESVAFRDLIETIEAETANAPTLLRLFAEWRIIESREHLQLADGRMAALDKLETFIDEGALEVTELQPLLEQHLWLLDPAWSEADIQPTYTKLLRKNCGEPKALKDEERRLDILGVTSGGRMTVVELKRPEKTLSRTDLEQIEKYVDWARTNIMGTGPDAPKYIDGLLIVGGLSSKAEIQKKMERLSGDDIRVQTFRDLHRRSREHYSEVEKRLEKIAPEYRRARRKKKGGGS